MKKDRICKHCGNTFNNIEGRVFANHVRWCDPHVDTTNIKSAIQSRFNNLIGEIETHTRICKNDGCGKTFTVTCRKTALHKQPQCCSTTCAHILAGSNPRQWTPEMKMIASQRSKKQWESDEYIDLMTNRKTMYTSKGELEVRNHFKINYPTDGWTHGGSLLYNGDRLVRDLFSPILKICIEYDGIWHFKNIKNQLADKQRKDKNLELWCVENGWRIIRIDDDVYNADKSGSIVQLEHHVYSSTEPVIKLGSRYTISS